MFKKLFGGSKTTLTNAEVEKEMKVEDGQRFGASDDLQLYGGFQELNDYYFFEGLFVSNTNFKTKSGATIEFKGKKGDILLTSSLQEFECDYARPLQRHVAQISFDVTKAQIKKIQNKEYESIEFKVKKKVFNLVKA